MIGVSCKPEYPNFNAEVRQPGSEFLAVCPTPTSKQFKKKNFWSKAAGALHEAYSGICAYTAVYLPERGSVDHFLPKNRYPHLAYEWNNFRLASGRVNSSKADLENIVDPFDVEDDWFFIDLPACLLKPNPALDRNLRNKIENTINSLRLNRDDYHVQERCEILMSYAREEVSMSFLERRYPFIAKEVKRQGLDRQTLTTVFKI